MIKINYLIVTICVLYSYAGIAQHHLKLQGKSTEFVSKFERISKSGNNKKDVNIKLPNDRLITVSIENERNVNGLKSYLGKVKDENSFFNLRTLPNQKLEGRIILKDKKQAFKLYADDQNNVYTEAIDINEAICFEYKKYSAPLSIAKSNALSLGSIPTGPALYELQSYPQASAVVLLDFDGQYVPAGYWGNAITALPGNFSEQGIYESWQKISEDFRPFKLNITTSESVYQNAPTNKRMRVIFTPTTTALPGSGGVAFVGSFTWGNETPCWVFNEGSQSGGDSGSHEIGHTLNLIHDGRDDGVTHEEYYFGSDNFWAPIMGTPGFAQDLVQWSKGEYNFATNHEDDIAIIAGTANGFGFRDDLVGNTITTATPLVVSNMGEVSLVDNNGVIENASDVDVFSFNTSGGFVYLNVVPFTPFTDLNIQLTIRDANNNVRAVLDGQGYYTTVTLDFEPGTYYVCVKGVGEGDPATIGYSDYASIGSYSIEGSIPVINVTGVSISPTTASVAVNSTKQITATIAPSNATNKSVTWSSSNTAIATVTNTGLVTGKAAGIATITVTTQDGNKTAISTITVNSVAVTGVSVSPTSASIIINGTKQLTATITPSNATNKNVTWSSSNTTIATVNTSGLVTGKAVGTATITVTTQNGSKTATSTITVNSVAATGVSVNPTSASIIINGTKQLTATITPSNATNKNVTWSSSNATIATVSTTGLVTGKTAGAAIITVTTQDGGKTATTAITVSSGIAVTSVSVNPTSASVNIDATQQLTAIISPSNATNKTVAWSSNNTTIATVSTTGLVTGKAAGIAIITATTQDGNKTATSIITVTASLGSWGTSTRYEAENGFNSCISTSSSNGGYSGTGYVTGLTTTCSETKFDKGVNTITPTRIDIHYANGTAANITNLGLYVGSNQKIQDLVLPPTGSWSTWSSISIIFNHNPSWGSNIIIKSVSNVTTSANLDYCDLYVGAGSRASSEINILKPEQETEEVSAYPNPAHDILNISFYSTNEDDALIELITTMSHIAGIKKHHAVKGKNVVVFDVNGLESGLYMLQVSCGSKRSIRKVIIGR